MQSGIIFLHDFFIEISRNYEYHPVLLKMTGLNYDASILDRNEGPESQGFGKNVKVFDSSTHPQHIGCQEVDFSLLLRLIAVL
jgi:hypothetical protein